MKYIAPDPVIREINVPTSAESSGFSPILSGVFALAGALVGSMSQWFVAERAARRQRSYQIEDSRFSQEEMSEKLRIAASFAAFLAARHLEQYAKSCADTVGVNESDDGGYEGFPIFPDWPNLKWKMLGIEANVRCRDFEARTRLHMEWASGNVQYGASDEREAAAYYARAAARAGWEAWQIASDLREQADLLPFRFDEHNWKFPDTLKDSLDREQLREKWIAEQNDDFT